MNIVLRVGCLVLGYLFGMIQTAYFYGRAHGIDIREHGSGNAGTTNTLRVLGKKAGLIVFIGDICKMAIPVLLIGIIINNFFPEYSDIRFLLKLYFGFGGIIGHNFPFYLGFKGGKGIAATSGMILGFHWTFVPVDLLLFFGTLTLIHYVSLSSMILMAGFLGQMILMGVLQIGPFTDISSATMLETYIVTFVIVAMAYIRHIPNLKRLATHTERKTYIFKKNSEEK